MKERARFSIDAPLMVIAALLISSGLAHLLIWMFGDTSWEGPVSWRKPILFGISTGLTAWSLHYVWRVVRPRKLDQSLQYITAIAILFEVFLITLQTWRGVPSHFNHSTTLDTAIHWGMDICIVWITLVISDLTFRIYKQDASKNTFTLAYQQGMLLLLVSCVFGFLILWLGFGQQAAGGDPTQFGNAGVLKFPHGIVIHALQFLPILAWASARNKLSGYLARLTVCIASSGCWGLLIFSLLQTFTGHSRFDMNTPNQLLFGVSIAAILMSLILCVIGSHNNRWKKQSPT